MKKLTGQKLQQHDKNWQPVSGEPYSSFQKIMDAGYIKLNHNGIPVPDAIGYYDELILNR